MLFLAPFLGSWPPVAAVRAHGLDRAACELLADRCAAAHLLVVCSGRTDILWGQLFNEVFSSQRFLSLGHVVLRGPWLGPGPLWMAQHTKSVSSKKTISTVGT